MLKADQAALDGLGKKLEGVSLKDRLRLIKPVAQKCQKRSAEVLELLNVIKEPTIVNIGQDGSEAILVLTLHSNINIMEKVLNIYEKSITKDSSSVALDYVAVLVDRISIIRTRKQKLGTIWLEDINGVTFIAPIINIRDVNKRRINYGLDPIRNRTGGSDSLSAIRELQKEVNDDVYNLNFAFMDKDLI